MSRLRPMGFGLALFALIAPQTASAFEQTRTCYPAEDTRTPTCKKDETSYPVRWFTPCTTWRTHEDLPDEFLDAILQSFQSWNEVASSYFKTYYAGSSDQFGASYDCSHAGAENENVVSFLEDWPSSIAGSNVVALTSVTFRIQSGEIVDADIRMNGDNFRWEVIESFSADTQRVDIQNIMTHEVGHFLGLEHTRPETYAGNLDPSVTTMWADTYPNEVRKRVLDLDDILGVSTIYPLEEKPDEPCEPPQTLNHQISAADFNANNMKCTTRKSKGCCSASESDPVHWPLIFFASAALLFVRQRAATSFDPTNAAS